VRQLLYYPASMRFSPLLAVRLVLSPVMIKKLLPVVLLTVLLQACILYVPDVEQGNIVTPDMLKNVDIGQTRDQVKYHLGTPLVADPFHRDRWDYYYSLEKGRTGKRTDKRLTIVFKNDRVSEIIRE